MIERSTFTGANPGISLLVFGAIHGDEPCGPEALARLEEQLKTGALKLSSGTLTIVRIANPEAYQAGKRMLKENLNRIFKKYDAPTTYEQQIANELTTLIDEHDVLLDIHSTKAPGPVNVFVDYPTEENRALAQALCPDVCLYDWPSVYEAHPDLSADTTDKYAHEKGKIGVLIECGQHTDPASVTVAQSAVLRTLAHFNMIENKESKKEELHTRSVYMRTLYLKESESDMFSKSWNHLETIPAGTSIATRASGEEIKLSEDCVIILPKDYAQPGGEWFYLGIEKN